MRVRQIGEKLPRVRGEHSKNDLSCHHLVLLLHQKPWIRTETKHVQSVTQVMFVYNAFGKDVLYLRSAVVFFQKPTRPRQLQVTQVVLGEMCKVIQKNKSSLQNRKQRRILGLIHKNDFDILTTATADVSEILPKHLGWC